MNAAAIPSPNPPLVQESAFKRIVVFCVSLALVLTAFSSVPAQAATSATVSGTGSTASTTFSLDPGTYQVDFQFSGNKYASGTPTYMWALVRDSADANTFANLFDARAENGTSKTFFTVKNTTSLIVKVSGATGAAWSAKITKASLPAASTAKTSFSQSATGPIAQAPFYLTPGVYSFTMTYSGNVDGSGVGSFKLALAGTSTDYYGTTLESQWTAEARTGIIKNLEVKQAGVYWFNTTVVPTAKWKVDVKRIANLTFTYTSKPGFSGIAKVGEVVRSDTGYWNPAPQKFTYQWLRNGKAIKGATKSTYKLTAADMGEMLRVRVTASSPGYTSVTETSDQDRVGKKLTLKKGSVKISGTKKVGKKLTAKTSGWTKGTKFTYQWQRNGKPIKNATSKTYKLKKADKGKKISVKVTGKKGGYKTASKVSSKTAKIK